MLSLAILLLAASTASAALSYSDYAVKIEQYPFQATVQARGRPYCGGAIIGPKHVVTSATCLEKQPLEKSREIKIGTGHRYRGGQIYDIVEMEFCPDYDFSGPNSNIAVAILNDTIRFDNKNITAIPLVARGAEPKVGEELTFTGWGTSGAYSAYYASTELLAGNLTVNDRQGCRNAYSYYKLNVTNTMFCAGLSFPETCLTDYGGPIINQRNELVGVASWAPEYGCPAVFTSVAAPEVNDFLRNVVTSKPNSDE